MPWELYLESPGLLSQSCSCCRAAPLLCQPPSPAQCGLREVTLTGKACCRHSCSTSAYCNKTYQGIKDGICIFHFVILVSFTRIWRNLSIFLKNVEKYVFLQHLLLMQFNVCVHPAKQVQIHTWNTSLFLVMTKPRACCYPHPLNHMPTVVSIKPPVISGIYNLSITILRVRIQRSEIEDGSWEQHGFLCTMLMETVE